MRQTDDGGCGNIRSLAIQDWRALSAKRGHQVEGVEQEDQGVQDGAADLVRKQVELASEVLTHRNKLRGGCTKKGRKR